MPALERALALSVAQRLQVEEVLLRRQEEIKVLHDGIRKAGVLDIRTFEWQVGLLKADWYRRIDAILDRAQHDQFVVLAEGGLFNEGLAFTVEPGMTILE